MGQLDPSPPKLSQKPMSSLCVKFQPSSTPPSGVGPNCELKTLGLLKSKNIFKDFEGQRNLKAKDFWLHKNFMFKRDLSPEKFVSLIS